MPDWDFCAGGNALPIYAYKCEQCDHEMEAIQSIKEDPLSECPNCGKAALKKQVSAPAFQFKGGGWYKDLYSSSGGQKADSSTPSKSDATSRESKTTTPAASEKPSGKASTSDK